MSLTEGVPLGSYTTDEVWHFHELRAANDADFQNRYKLPDFSQDPADVYERLNDLEKGLVPVGDYFEGSATKDDDILPILGVNGTLLTAEHATVHVRVKEDGARSRKLHEGGTGALAIAIALDTDSFGLIPKGRQTGDANKDKSHPIKEKISEIVAFPISHTHLPFHGMIRAHALEIEARRGFSAQLGIGNNPSEATLALKDVMEENGKNLGLNVKTNKRHIKINIKEQRPVLLDDHTLATQLYSAPKLATRGYSESEARRLGKGDSFAAIQVELSDVLRVHPWEEAKVRFPTQRDREIGAYLGYHFLLAAVNSANELIR